MTLCAAWIRHGQRDEGRELVFVTDSRLGGGEAWDQGIKLFDLGRTDCLLCFTGVTTRAYPLILQGSNLKRLNIAWSNPRLDVYDVLESICSLFTEVCAKVEGVPTGTDFLVGSDYVDFLFGGWSWRRQHFGIWKIRYSPELQAFVHEAVHESGVPRIYTFLGDHIDEAEELLEVDLRATGNLKTGLLDMEPMHVIAVMSRDQNNYPSIGGALQIAKVYRSGNSEFFGVMWPSNVNGSPAFLGREVKLYDAPPVRLLDPDTTGYIENLPIVFNDIDAYNFGDEMKFVQDCYPDRRLDPSLPEVQRNRLRRIFRDQAYREFVVKREIVSDAEDVQIVEESAEAEPVAATAEITVGEEGASNE